MCKAFSCIVLKDRTVLWKFGVDSHDDILKMNNIPDDTADADKVAFCRVEIIPRNNDYFNPDIWMFNIDQNPIPVWMEEDHEQACWKAFWKWKENFEKILIKKQIINPFEIEPPEITDKHISLLKKWNSYRASIKNSIYNSNVASIWESTEYRIWKSIGGSIRDSIWASISEIIDDSYYEYGRDFYKNSVRISIYNFITSYAIYSVRAYAGSYFILTKESWEYMRKRRITKYPYQSVVDLWEMGLVPSFDGKKWRLHSKNGIEWEGVFE